MWSRTIKCKIITVYFTLLQNQMSSKDAPIGEAVPTGFFSNLFLRYLPLEFSGNGRKSYTVHGSSFEVPVKYNLIKAVGYGAYGLVCSAVNSETQEKVS